MAAANPITTKNDKIPREAEADQVVRECSRHIKLDLQESEIGNSKPHHKKVFGQQSRTQMVHTTELRKPLDIKIQKHLVELVQDSKIKKKISHNNTTVAIRSSSHNNHNPKLLNPFYSNKENKFRSNNPNSSNLNLNSSPNKID